MNTFEAIQKRRAVKHFDPDHDMTDDEMNHLFENVILSPTSFNIQNWRLVAVTDKELRKNIQDASWNQAQITESSLLVVLCADLKTWAKNPERYWQNAPEEVRNFMVPAIGQFYDGKDQLQRDEAMRSCGIAAQTLMLAAKALGYDSCPMIGFDEVKVAKLIKLPEDHIICMFVVVGKALKEARPRGGQLPLEEVVIRNHF